MIDGKFIYEVIVMKKAFTLIEFLIVVAITGILLPLPYPTSSMPSHAPNSRAPMQTSKASRPPLVRMQ